MKKTETGYNGRIRGSEEYLQCSTLWRNLPGTFKLRWKNEAEKFSTSGYWLFLKTNMKNLNSGNEIQIAPWH